MAVELKQLQVLRLNGVKNDITNFPPGETTDLSGIKP